MVSPQAPLSSHGPWGELGGLSSTQGSRVCTNVCVCVRIRYSACLCVWVTDVREERLCPEPSQPQKPPPPSPACC